VPARIRPEPSDEQREALLLALAVLDGRGDEPSPWWQAGVREAVEDELDAPE
jgi:hypothetical protein